MNTAIYGRPHVQGRDEVVFIMLDRRSHANLAENPHACYLFLEEGTSYRGCASTSPSSTRAPTRNRSAP